VLFYQLRNRHITGIFVGEPEDSHIKNSIFVIVGISTDSKRQGLVVRRMRHEEKSHVYWHRLSQEIFPRVGNYS